LYRGRGRNVVVAVVAVVIAVVVKHLNGVEVVRIGRVVALLDGRPASLLA
jgi:hypothetical protein